jgi:hypothetical protein
MQGVLQTVRRVRKLKRRPTPNKRVAEPLIIIIIIKKNNNNNNSG